MAEDRAGVKNTTVKQVLRLLDGIDEMAEERLARMQMQMIRSQSADIASGYLIDADGVDDRQIAIKNLGSMRQAINDAIDATEIVIRGAKNAHHDHEELSINNYSTPGGVDE